MKAQYRPWIRITFLVTLLYSFGVVVLIAFLDLAINPLFTTIFYNYPSWCGMTSQCQGYSEPSLFQLLLAGAPWRNGVSESFLQMAVSRAKCNTLRVIEQGAGPLGWRGPERGLAKGCAS